MKPYLLSNICDELGLSFEGEDRPIEGIHTLHEANASQLSFLHSTKYLDQLPHTQAAAVLVEARYLDSVPSHTIALVTDEPYLMLAYATKFFAHKITTETLSPQIGEGCDIDESVRFGKGVVIGDGVSILPGCYIGDSVTIGSGTLLYPNVTIYHGCEIGSKCVLHAGTVIGSDGFGFAHTSTGEHVKIYQNGTVLIEDEVEIGANCAIDRAVFGATIIRRGSKLDNLIQIAHNCDIGAHSLLASQVGLAGSTTMGRNVVMGGQSASAGHLHIGDFSTIAGKGGVTKTLEGKKTYSGFPAIEHQAWLRTQAKLSRLLKNEE
jgi:UDP-3-O-[3-hydroxymyristoyl] glucosamine N-acyltransferase